MREPPSLLVLDDDDVFRRTLADELRRRFRNVRSAQSGVEGLRLLDEDEPDVLLLDLNLGDEDGLEVLARVREVHPSVEVIVITAFATVDAAVEAMRGGAYDFITKPLKLDALVAIIERAVERRDLRRQNVGLRRMLDRGTAPELIGVSGAVRGIRETIARAARTTAPVLISGPSGCGKELVARALHAASDRAGQAMVTVNCAALQESLLESELFGHERGAFTGATEQRPGLFEAAHRTTLFLDEVAELPPALQAKLLRAVQFGEIRRVGGVTSLKVDVRIVAATNRDLLEAVNAGEFREDLYYRLNVVAIRVPPLRERPEDIEPIWRALAGARDLGYELGREHFDVLREYGWPGNVREMENLMERLKLLGPTPPDPTLLLAHLEPRAHVTTGIRPLADLEREVIDRALRHFGGDRKAAAKALGISVRTLYYRLSSYGRDMEL